MKRKICYVKLKVWEIHNTASLAAFFLEWDKNPRIGTSKLFEAFENMVDVVMPIKNIKTKTGNSRFPLSPLFYELKKIAQGLRKFLRHKSREHPQFKKLTLDLKKERKTSLRQAKNRKAIDRTQS